jgi:hypothetical protein
MGDYGAEKKTEYGDPICGAVLPGWEAFPDYMKQSIHGRVSLCVTRYAAEAACHQRRIAR